MPDPMTSEVPVTDPVAPTGTGIGQVREITSRLAMKVGSSPRFSMRESQKSAASGSEPRMVLMKAEMVS